MILEVRNVCKSFSELQALRDVSFEVAEGSIVGVIGPNGAGKTTLFNIIAGRTAATSGDVILEGESVVGLAAHRRSMRGVARTFQLMRPFGSMTALENIIVASLVERPRRAEAVAAARTVAIRVGLEQWLERPAKSLDRGSEATRVGSCARA